MIKDTVSKKIRNIFKADAQKKLDIIDGILKNNEFAEKKEEVNRILDKILEHGIDSLTEEEKATLNRASGEMKH